MPSCLDLPYSSLSLTCNGNSPVKVHFAEVSNNSPESPRENLLPVCTGRRILFEKSASILFFPVEILTTAPAYIKIYRRFSKRVMKKVKFL